MSALEPITVGHSRAAAREERAARNQIGRGEDRRINKKRSWQTIRRFAMTSILKRDPRVSRPPGGLYRNYRRRARRAGANFSVCAASAWGDMS